MSNLREELKAQIIEQLNLEDLTPSDINNDGPLFGSFDQFQQQMVRTCELLGQIVQ